MMGIGEQKKEIEGRVLCRETKKKKREFSKVKKKRILGKI